jgi:ubiquinone/menaquinone biosynthesis C-methylase UbiE
VILVSPEEGYRLWAATFDAAPNPVVAREARYLGARLSEVKGKCVVDVCCGTGRWLAWLAARGWRGAGCDASPEMLQEAKRKADCAVACADALRIPFSSGIADIVLCTLSLGYLRLPGLALREMRRVARTGGVVIVTDLHPEAVRSGWTRSFRSGQVVYEIANYPYSLDDLSVDGLKLESSQDLFLGAPEKKIFEQAGKAAFFEEACKIPAVWMLEWRAV